jgi:hypothetical protein
MLYTATKNFFLQRSIRRAAAVIETSVTDRAFISLINIYMQNSK